MVGLLRFESETRFERSALVRRYTDGARALKLMPLTK